jgi:hypothetical protein
MGLSIASRIYACISFLYRREASLCYTFAVHCSFMPLLCVSIPFSALAQVSDALHDCILHFSAIAYQSNVELRRCALSAVMPTSAIAMMCFGLPRLCYVDLCHSRSMPFPALPLQIFALQPVTFAVHLSTLLCRRITGLSHVTAKHSRTLPRPSIPLPCLTPALIRGSRI